MKNFSRSILAIVCFIFSNLVYAGTVTKVDAKKKLVTIDQGSDAGIAKDAEVCFTDEAGKKITCGFVKSVKTNTAVVKVKSKKAIKKIVEGTTAALSAGGETAATGGEKKVGKGGAKLMAIRLLFLPAILAQAVYNNMTYATPELEGTVETLWEPRKKSKSAITSIGFEFDLVAYGIALGIRPLRSYQALVISSDYDRTVKEIFAETSVSASAIGFYLDYNFLNPKAIASGLRIGAGIDIDQSTVVYSLDQRDERDASKIPLYRITSKLTVISLRVPVGYELNLGAFGLNFGANLMVPVVGNKAVATNEITDGNTGRYVGSTEEQTTTATNDLSKSLGHTKSSFAAELVLGAFFAF
jgi:hypothetical protein